MQPSDIVLLSTADWDNPFWTNKQHVAVELARRGFRVLYIDSLGLRRPSLNGRDVRRIGRRVLRGMRAPRQVRPNLWVWSPIVLPYQGNSWVRSLNRVFLGIGLRLWMKRLKFSKAVLWSYNPLSLQLLNLSIFSKVIYHCVDELKAQPGLPVDSLESAETEFVKRADIVFVTSRRLAETRVKLNANTHYFSNVADYEHFSASQSMGLAVPGDLLGIPAPRIGFIGAISSYKVDFSLLRLIATRHPEWSVVLIGKVGEGDPGTDTSTFAGLTNVHLLGPRDYRDLPAYLKGFDVAMLPNVLNEYTASMFPMKFFEYLAAGRSIVSVDLHALQEYGEVAHLASSPQDFISAIEEILRGKIVPVEKRLALARQHTYSSRMEHMLLLAGLGGGNPQS